MKIRRIPELKVAGKALGRHVEHDPRSRAFAAPAVTTPLVSKAWRRHCDAFDQNEVGSCTGEALAGLVMTEPFFKPGRILTQTDAVDLYSQATRLDKISGSYPPDDTGSSGLAVAKAGQRNGFFRGYHHAFGLHSALSALTRGPVLLGIDWYEGFDKPVGQRAELMIAGEVRGCHEVEILEIDVAAQLVRGVNSWGMGWGDSGRFCLSWETLEKLLARDGDVVVPTL